MTLDDRTVAALARLTANEREALRRRLNQQTAKEIAIDLGVSPHAIEKRLKMARAKLGVSSSLQAARMLAAAESQQSVPQISGLDAADPASQRGRQRLRWAVFLMIGGIGMIVLIALLAAQVPTGTADKSTPANAEAFAESSFALMDRDKSGFIEVAEAPPAFVRASKNEPLPRHPLTSKHGSTLWIATYDLDSDGKVSRAEFIRNMVPYFVRRGVPANWKPGP